MRWYLLLLLLLCADAVADEREATRAITRSWEKMHAATAVYDAGGSVEFLAEEYRLTFAERPGLEMRRADVLEANRRSYRWAQNQELAWNSCLTVLAVEAIGPDSVKALTRVETAIGDKQGFLLREEIWSCASGAWMCQSIHVPLQPMSPPNEEQP